MITIPFPAALTFLHSAAGILTGISMLLFIVSLVRPQPPLASVAGLLLSIAVLLVLVPNG